MSTQLNMFKESGKLRYKKFYNHFYKGVREKQEKVTREFKNRRSCAISISILIKPLK